MVASKTQHEQTTSIIGVNEYERKQKQSKVQSSRLYELKYWLQVVGILRIFAE